MAAFPQMPSGQTSGKATAPFNRGKLHTEQNYDLLQAYKGALAGLFALAEVG